MKKILLQPQILSGQVGRVICLFLLFTFLISNAYAGKNTSSAKRSFKDSIVITTIINNKKHQARLYPDLANKNLLFAANGKKGKIYQLFVFDMDGKLVNQTRILEKQTEHLDSITKGNYLFEVFSDDLRIENGSIAIK